MTVAFIQWLVQIYIYSYHRLIGFFDITLWSVKCAGLISHFYLWITFSDVKAGYKNRAYHGLELKDSCCSYF